MRWATSLCILASLLCLGATGNEDRVKRLPTATRKQLERFQALSVPSLNEMTQAVAPQRLEQRTREILALGNLGIGSRSPDLPVQQFLRRQIDALSANGVVLLGSLKGTVMAPVTLPGTAVSVGDQSWALQPIWPNGVMPSLCPTNGITGPLVWTGKGDWGDIRGQELRGAIALMEFEGGRNWERLYSHGAKAVIVVESERMLREKAEGLFYNTPAPFPRFYVNQATGAALRERAGRQCRLDGGALYQQQPIESLFAYLPPTPPLRHVVREGETLQSIAIDYQSSVEALAESNNFTDIKSPVSVGTELVIPNFNDSLVVAVPIDAVNVVPDAPHGAKVAANLAVALSGLEHLATSPHTTRRKGILFAFLDGEHMGGLASRGLAESYLRATSTWTSDYVADSATTLKRYRTARAWWKGEGDVKELNKKDAEWFGVWLKTRIDEKRILLAEERALLLQKKAATDAIDERISAMVKLTQATIDRLRYSWPVRVTKFREQIDSANIAGVTAATLLERFEQELAQEEARTANEEHNLRLARAFDEKIGRYGTLGFWVDLGDADSSVVISEGKNKLRTVASDEKYNQRFRDVAVFAAVQGGWTVEWPFLTDMDRVDMAFTVRDGPAYYPDFWLAANVRLMPVTTANDMFDRLDTPADVIERTNFKNLSVQARTAMLMWKIGLESPVDSIGPGRSTKKNAFGRLVGKCVQFNVRSGLDAQQPVADCWVYYPGLKRLDDNPANTATFRGMRRGIIVPSLLNGSFVLPIESLEWNSTSKSKPHVYAYRLDRGSALMDKVVDRGRVGTQQLTPAFKLLFSQDIEKKLVMTEATPLVFFPGLDPTDYRPVGKEQLVIVQDAVLRGQPAHYSYDHPANEYNEDNTEANLLYLPAKRHVQYLVRRGNSYKLLLVGEVSDKDPEGKGLFVGGAQTALALTPLEAARQMHTLALRRQALYHRFGITDQAVSTALERAGEKLATADQAVAAKHWQEVSGNAREAWGILIKFYPRILTMGRQAVFSAVLLMALLLPASAFAEKILLGGKGIVARLVGTTLIFAAGVIILNFLHPAFRISVSPFIVVIAYTMILMSSIVLLLCYQRFEVLVRRARAAGGEVESEEISVVSSLSTALSLGVSNLKKRKTRTFLTAFTVTALTFSIVTFVSVKGTDTLLVRPMPLDKDVEGQIVEPLPPKYEGMMMRNIYWAPQAESMSAAVISEFGNQYQVAQRAFYLEAEGGNNAEREGINQIDIRHGRKNSILMGIMAFEPQERDFSHLHETVSGQQWFLPTDLFHCILPDNAAAALGITAADLLQADGTRKPDAQLPLVRFRNHTWRVIGILNTKEADRYRDVNGKSLAMVDYLRSGYTPKAGGGDIANETPGYHISWQRLVIIPLAARTEVQATLRSVVVRFPPGADTKSFYQDLALRVTAAVFGTVDGKLSLLTTQQKQSVGGIAKILVPVILAILIVTNTMLGAVEERKGEVGMLGAIGLSPAQISFLLLSESMVFSIIGIVCGTFSGLAFANLVPLVRLHMQPDFLVTLSLNFASLSAIGLALGTGVVVLLATLFPAKKAARLAAPSGMEKWELPAPADDGRIRYVLPFTLTRGNAVGMMAFFRRFLLNHTESTSQDFNCRHIRLECGAALIAKCTMWLQPYDLDVAQQFEMRVLPTDNEGIFAVALTLHRTSGTEEAWLRTNYGFLDLVRRQFLLWRNLDDDSRKRYINEGVELYKNVGSATSTPAVASHV